MTDEAPVLIGCGQLTDRRPPKEAASPLQLIAEASRRAAADAGPGDALLQALDAVALLGLAVDSDPIADLAPLRTYRNLPRSVCGALGIDPAEQITTSVGGNYPQALVNHYAERIAEGDLSAVLIAGGEALATMGGLLAEGVDLSAWREEDAGGDPAPLFEPPKAPATPRETAHGLDLPANVYPLFENALRGHYGRSLEAHAQAMGALFHPLTQVAAANPDAWYPIERDAETLAQPGPGNRMVAAPYTKYLNAAIQVNMAAALILTSRAKARALGVAEDQLVYLHGCADANDIWNVTERPTLHASPAMRLTGAKALEMAGVTLSDIDSFDIYSCFPSAVAMACDAYGLAHDDPRGLTLTGGLPYFGGPGNNYSTHAIVAMMRRLRARPGSFGLLNANGWYITKHSVGVYSTSPLERPWRRAAPSQLQAEIDAEARTPVTEAPDGAARIETYTVLHDRAGPTRGIVIGRLEDDRRFIAETPGDADTLRRMTEQEMLGVRGVVESGPEKSVFTPV